MWFEIGNFEFGISYDLNVSQLRASSNMRGGMELSLRFVNPNPFSYGKGGNLALTRFRVVCRHYQIHPWIHYIKP